MKSYLGHEHHVGSHTAILQREIFSGPPEPALHFVDNKENVMLVADLSETLQELWRRRDVTPFANHSLDQNSGCIVWRSLLRQKKLELIQREPGEFFSTR